MPDAVQPDPQRAPLTIADLGERPDELVPEALQSELEDHLIAAARAADAAGHPRRATALRLLADACSLMLDSDNPAQPFPSYEVILLKKRSKNAKINAPSNLKNNSA